MIRKNAPYILILAGETRAALACVRSLGRKEEKIVVAAESFGSLASFSRFTSTSVISPPPAAGVDKFINWLNSFLRNNPGCKLIIPCSDWSVLACASWRERLSRTELNDESSDFAEKPSIAIPTLEQIKVVHDKLEFAQRCRLQNFDTPATRLLTATEAHEIPLPAVVKARFSASENNSKKVSVKYLKNKTALIRLAHDTPPDTLVVQTQLQGTAYGVSALFWNGRFVSDFCHRRLLEKPPSGGVSALAEAVAQQDTPGHEACIALLRSLKWHGLAMVEIKCDADQKPYLLEINPRPWGTIQLAISAGRDFPGMILQLCSAKTGEKIDDLIKEIKRLPNYNTKVRLRWTLGTLDHALIRLKNEGIKGACSCLFKNSLLLHSQTHQTISDTFSPSDPGPFILETAAWIWQALGGAEK